MAIVRKETKREYFYEILIRKTYKIYSSSRSKAMLLASCTSLKHQSENVQLIEETIVKTRLLSKSMNKISKGNGTSKRIGWQ